MNPTKTPSPFLSCSRFLSVLFALCAALSRVQAQTTYYELDFSNPVQSSNGTDSQLGAYYSGLSYDFRNVASSSSISVDLRLSVAVNNPTNYAFVGSYPNFNTSSANRGDLGFEYEYIGNKYVNNGSASVTGGITYTLTFYEGGGTFSKEFVIPNFQLMIYDVDGESNQSETVKVFAADGFSGYQLPSIGGISVTQNQALGMHSFTGAGVNREETDASGAFILHFQETSQIRLVMEATTSVTKHNWNTVNGVFSAIDGDLGLISPEEFDPITPLPVPEPSSALLVLGAGVAAFIFGRRRNSLI